MGVLEDVVAKSMEIDGIYLADGHWGDVNLAVVNWSSLKILGEELDAQRVGTGSAYEKAARVNRQLAVALRDQGLSEEATRFAYQAHVLQREVLRQRISRWRRQPGAFQSLLRFLGVVGGVATLILFFLFFGIASSIGSQQRQCRPDSFDISRQSVCPSLLAQLGHLSPALLIPTCIILGVLALTFLPVLYLRQKAQQTLKQVLVLLLVLMSGLLLLVLPLLLSVSPVLEYLGSQLTHLDSELVPGLQIFLLIWAGQFLLLCLPWSRLGNRVGNRGRGKQWMVMLILEEVICILLSLLHFASPVYYGLPSNQELSSLLPEAVYMNFFPFSFVYSPQFPFLWFTFLLLLLSIFFLPLSKMQWLRISWGLLLVMVLGWFVILEDQLQGLAEYRKYYGLPGFEWTLVKLGPVSPGLLFLLFLLVIPIIQRVPKIRQLRKWMYNQPKTSLKEILAGYGQYTLSLFLDAIAGYGYKPSRTLGWYVSAILIFTVVYSLVGTASGDPLSLNEALVFSVTSFHGRGFFPGIPQDPHLLRNPLVVFAAFEAIIGLIIEISFIATFTQRFFGK